jgi:hypothetical protein
MQITDTTLRGGVKIFVKFSTPLKPATIKKTEDKRLLKLPLSAQYHTNSRIEILSKEKAV